MSQFTFQLPWFSSVRLYKVQISLLALPSPKHYVNNKCTPWSVTSWGTSFSLVSDWSLCICGSVHRQWAEVCSSAVILSPSDRFVWHFTKIKREDWPVEMKVQQITRSEVAGSEFCHKHKRNYGINNWQWECWHCHHLRESRFSARET